MTWVPLLAALTVVAVAAARRPTPTRSVAPAATRPRRFVVSTIAARSARPARQPEPSAVAAWCDELSREVRSGTTLRHALATVVPQDAPTRTHTAPLRLGLGRARPVGELVDADAGAHLRLAMGAIAAATAVGGPAAPALDRVAATLRRRAADRDERRSQAAQARLSAHVMTAVPLVMLALLVSTDADVRTIVVTPIGVGCLGAGLVLNATGWLWMRRIVGGRR